ncbi:MAG: hypothetical protein QNJ64_15715 [Crocosphaera sp.]|nr:hypothetical protein [Crocosphaera sp.]
MKIKWKQLLIKGSLWLLIEIYLNFVGIDDLADYGEFVFERHFMVFLS